MSFSLSFKIDVFLKSLNEDVSILCKYFPYKGVHPNFSKELTTFLFLEHFWRFHSSFLEYHPTNSFSNIYCLTFRRHCLLSVDNIPFAFIVSVLWHIFLPLEVLRDLKNKESERERGCFQSFHGWLHSLTFDSLCMSVSVYVRHLTSER